MGMQVIEHGIEVSGVNYRFNTVKKFAKRRKKRIYLKREPGNKNPPNKIKVIAKSKGWFFETKKCIGYVPTDIANQLIDTGLEERVKVRLRLIWIEDKNYMGVRFDLVGRNDAYEKYHS